MTNSFYKQAAETYKWRKDAAVSQTVDLDQKLKDLERLESNLLNRLQNTRRVAAAEFSKLKQVRNDSEAQAHFYATQYTRKGGSLAMNSTNGRTITEQDEDEEEHQRNVRFGPSPAKLRAELRR